MDKIQQGHINASVENNVGIIEFYHPSHNSLPGKLLAELESAIYKMDKNEDATIIVLKAAGDRTFCAGASFDELASIEDEVVGKTFFMGFANVINAIRKISKIVIGRVHGKAVGGGVGLAAACDYCMATKFASIKLSELAVGIGPFVIGPAVERKMGVSAYSHMSINATEWRTADWAREKAYTPKSLSLPNSLTIISSILPTNSKTMNPEAMGLLKRVFWEGTDHWDGLLEERAEMSGRLVLSDFSKMAIGKFLN